MRQMRTGAMTRFACLLGAMLATAAEAAGPWELKEALPFRYGPLACDLGEATAARVECAWAEENVLTYAGSCRLEIAGADATRVYRAEAVVNPALVDLAEVTGLVSREPMTYAFGGISCEVEVPPFMGYSCETGAEGLSCRVCLYLFGYCVTAEGAIAADSE